MADERKNVKSQRQRRMSLGGGVDGHGRPLFSSLQASTPRHMTDGFEDMHPTNGPLSRAFKGYVNIHHGSGPFGSKRG
ncbi:hypothetical protein EX30DRAFT_372356 [Ascodesmis nigricans]|uniref:Uncharacterized protein n=1 Tax=Ascodesmis nigricans TaxID=341454 RepID=A0A4S2MUZ1_9PEZI|nr:hypothetical protein EX30DRAFT_372356 [Ascodesmis nigricans]